MIWQCTEILAVIVECMIVTRMMIQYFNFRSEDYRILKWLLLFSLLFATDMAGTFGMANETFLILSCLLIEIVFSAIFLKGSIFEKVLISIINYVLATETKSSGGNQPQQALQTLWSEYPPVVLKSPRWHPLWHKCERRKRTCKLLSDRDGSNPRSF